MKSKLEFFSVQLLINFVITRIFDTIIYKLIDNNIPNSLYLDYFPHSRELIISIVVLILTYMFYN